MLRVGNSHSAWLVGTHLELTEIGSAGSHINGAVVVGHVTQENVSVETNVTSAVHLWWGLPVVGSARALVLDEWCLDAGSANWSSYSVTVAWVAAFSAVRDSARLNGALLVVGTSLNALSISAVITSTGGVLAVLLAVLRAVNSNNISQAAAVIRGAVASNANGLRAVSLDAFRLETVELNTVGLLASVTRSASCGLAEGITQICWADDWALRLWKLQPGGLLASQLDAAAVTRAVVHSAVGGFAGVVAALGLASSLGAFAATRSLTGGSLARGDAIVAVVGLWRGAGSSLAAVSGAVVGLAGDRWCAGWVVRAGSGGGLDAVSALASFLNFLLNAEVGVLASWWWWAFSDKTIQSLETQA